MKSADLVGKRVDIVVTGTPCRCVMDGFEPLTESVSGVIEKFLRMPGGPVGVLHVIDGRKIIFDAGFDLKSGHVAIHMTDESSEVPSCEVCGDGGYVLDLDGTTAADCPKCTLPDSDPDGAQ